MRIRSPELEELDILKETFDEFFCSNSLYFTIYFITLNIPLFLCVCIALACKHIFKICIVILFF